jgi:hypothetical protein
MGDSISQSLPVRREYQVYGFYYMLCPLHSRPLDTLDYGQQ